MKIGECATKTLQLLQMAFSDNPMEKSGVFECHKRFKDEREDVTDDPSSGQPKATTTNINVTKVLDAMQSDRRLCVRTN